MIDFWLYIGFSMLETFAMFYFIFALFKIDIYPKEMVFASLIMAFFSYVMRTAYDLAHVDILFQIFLMFCFIWLLFKIHIFYATILTGMTYQAYMLIQGLYYFIMDSAGLFESDIPYILGVSTFILQTLSAGTAIGIGYYVAVKRKGFDFVPDKPNGKITVKRWEKVLFGLNIPSVIIAVLVLYFISHLAIYFIVVPLISAVVLYGYLYFSYKKDRAEDEYFGV